MYVGDKVFIIACLYVVLVLACIMQLLYYRMMYYKRRIEDRNRKEEK